MNDSQGPQDPREPLAILRRGIPLIAITALVAALVAYGLAQRQKALYQASANVFVATSTINAAVGNLPLLSTDPERVLATQAEVAQLPQVARLAAKKAGKGFTPGQLLGGATVTPSSGADSMNFTVTGPNPQRATRMVNAYAEGYVQYRRQLDTRALRQARASLQQQIVKLSSAGSAGQSAINDLLTQSQGLRTKELLQTQNSVLGMPATGAGQIQPHPRQSAILGGVIGLILGVALVFARDALNTRVRTAKEIEARLGIPLLGRIPKPPRRLAEANELAVLKEPHSSYSEAYRMLATSIEFSNVDRGAKSMMIVSAVRAEGKSTTTASLGVTFARRGYHVVIVEADVRRPTLAAMLHLERRLGLSDVVLGKAKLDEALVPVELPADQDPSTNGGGGGGGRPEGQGTLEVLLSGPAPPSPPEFLKSDAVARIIAELSERADLVLIDTPPLLHLSDVTTMILNSEIDCVIAAVRLGVARRGTVDELKRVFSSAPVIKLGFFTAGAPSSETYGYAYRYGYRSRSDRPVSPGRLSLRRGGDT